jgi:hypothetical protein
MLDYIANSFSAASRENSADHHILPYFTDDGCRLDVNNVRDIGAPNGLPKYTLNENYCSKPTKIWEISRINKILTPLLIFKFYHIKVHCYIRGLLIGMFCLSVITYKLKQE